MKLPITGDDLRRAALRLGCSTAAIAAVAEVESKDGGFNPDETPKTLFEGHQFHRLTNGRFDASHPTLSFEKWTREFYGRSWQDEQARLDRAKNLDFKAALLATSWGRFQIMGFNYALCGYVSVLDFVDDMGKSESKQLAAFVEFIEHRNMADELRDLRWADFARLYNGPDFAKNGYDQKLARAYTLALKQYPPLEAQP